MQHRFRGPLLDAQFPFGFAQSVKPTIGGSEAIGEVARVGRFVGQERRVGSDDAVLGREHHQFLDQFVVLSLEVDFVENLADSPHGPQLFDERQAFVAAMIDEVGREVEFLRRAIDAAGDLDLRRASFLVSPDNHQLLAGKQIVRCTGINPIHRLAGFRFVRVDVPSDFQIAQHRAPIRRYSALTCVSMFSFGRTNSL